MLNESATFLYKNCKDKNRDTLIHYFISNIDKKYPMPSQQDIINECNMVIDTLVDKKIIIENGET